MRAVFRPAVFRSLFRVLFCTIAFTVCQVLSSCGSSGSGTGPAPMVSAVAIQVNGVAPNRKQEVQFSEAMNPATIDGKTFVIRDAAGNLVTGNVTYDADYNVALFQPTPALATGAQYSGTVTTGAQSTGGRSLAAKYLYSFTTRADTDTSPLRVINTDPFEDQACVSATTAITITFNEAPDASTVTTSNIVVTDPNGNPIPVTLTMDIANTQVVATPKSALPNGTITVTVSNVADLADVPMQQPFQWSFLVETCSGG